PTNCSYSAILGDFNSIIDPWLDRSGNTRFFKKPSKLLELLEQNQYIDTYRFTHPLSRAFTWSANREELGLIETRIDHIWISPNWLDDLTFSDIIDPSLAFSTDHRLGTAMLDTGSIIRNHRTTRTCTWDNSRLIFEYDKASDYDWEAYADQVQQKLYGNTDLDSILLSLYPSQAAINQAWKMILDSVTTAAD